MNKFKIVRDLQADENSFYSEDSKTIPSYDFIMLSAVPFFLGYDSYNLSEYSMQACSDAINIALLSSNQLSLYRSLTSDISINSLDIGTLPGKLMTLSYEGFIDYNALSASGLVKLYVY